MSSCRRKEIRAALPATLEAVEEFFPGFRRWSEGLASRDRFAAELLLREALTNAVIHGSGGNPCREVRCAVRMHGARLTITVADEGEGFDWRTAWDYRAPALSVSGRGMEIFRTYATRVRFNRKGNVTSIVRRLGRGEEI